MQEAIRILTSQGITSGASDKVLITIFSLIRVFRLIFELTLSFYSLWQKKKREHRSISQSKTPRGNDEWPKFISPLSIISQIWLTAQKMLSFRKTKWTFWSGTSFFVEVDSEHLGKKLTNSTSRSSWPLNSKVTYTTDVDQRNALALSH